MDNVVETVIDDDPFGGTSAVWTMTNRQFEVWDLLLRRSTVRPTGAGMEDDQPVRL